ncbi:MAG: valine--tRNA ligase [Parcubacteria group bacterium CG10_big_fil_rev_8_21_14_0_10_38_31]|nr:MAG: valine--tRNA ligase [Parcubacteria group bacterium CG10_big_fil_rev_8_21_14_0_10_38_31]
MNEKLLKPYDPKETEDRIYKLWEKGGFFAPEAHQHRTDNPNSEKSYTIVLPPPNVTGALHMGHALNSTIQDILIRKKRMEGYKTLWLPGTDHAGIATQNVVEKKLKKEGITRHDLGKEKFLEKVWEWKEEYGDKILGQLKKLGASCDWSHTRFTMDEDYQKAVEKAFLSYYEKGLIYQGERVINWCKRCQTSLSDLELEYEEEKGNLYYINYPLKDDTSRFVSVATTRPETMLGDTAVAVNPKDDRYKDLIGKIITLPIANREIPIIADIAIDKDFGTGAVKVTPSHSIIDSEIGERHNLPKLKIIDQYGKMAKEAGEEFEGLSSKDARDKVIEKLKELNLLEKSEEHTHRVSKCYRCNSVIEPQPSNQWFLKMKGLADKTKEAIESGKVMFNDEKWKKVTLDWLSNIRDWCISRQIWWGHKIPLEGTDDVLDTWFSSALWPFATLGWPNACTQNKNTCTPQSGTDLEQFYPTQVISTARDIINLWVVRMIFSGLEFMDDTPPFTNIIIHPTVLAKDGRRMSKSLGTGVDPIDLIDKYGADATRFGLIYQMMGNQDMKFDESHLLAGKKFANKLWNIARFVLQNANEKIKDQNAKLQFKMENLTKEDKEILEKLDAVTKSVNKDIEEYNFGQALHTLYDFIWHDFADVYIEYSKSKETEDVKKVLYLSLTSILKLLHPFMPFITEEIWGTVPVKDKKPLIIETWPI